MALLLEKVFYGEAEHRVIISSLRGVIAPFVHFDGVVVPRNSPPFFDLPQIRRRRSIVAEGYGHAFREPDIRP
jgi:hypothetical protein